MEEYYKEITNYNTYLISNLGNIKIKKTNKIKSQYKQSNGYMYVSLYTNNKQKCFTVHNLVFCNFANQLERYDVIDHIDGNKLNNNISNLCASSFTNNTKNAYNKNINMNNRLKTVYKYDINMNLYQTYKSIADCRRDNNFKYSSQIINLSKSKKLYDNFYYLIEQNNISQTNLNNQLNTDEEFKTIDIFFGNKHSNYSISNYGKILHHKRNKIMKNQQNDTDYNKIILIDDNGKSHKYYIHRLVAYFFMSKYDKNMVINHLDKNKLNNYYKNLEITNVRSNIIHSSGKKIVQYDLKMNKIKDFLCIKDASNEINVNNSGNIVKCCKHKIKSAYGFIWRYNDN